MPDYNGNGHQSDDGRNGRDGHLIGIVYLKKRALATMAVFPKVMIQATVAPTSLAWLYLRLCFGVAL